MCWLAIIRLPAKKRNENLLHGFHVCAILKKYVEKVCEVKTMKEGIHPQYNKVQVTCACGETFESGSTRKEIRVEICSKCHPFFTGKQRIVDSGGQVDKFKKRLEGK